jgi:outer membrane lipoprotein SlyB
MGMNQGDLLGQLSQMLPQLVDKLTPNGQIPQGDIGGILGSMLGGSQGGAQAGGMGDLAGMLGSLLKR